MEYEIYQELVRLAKECKDTALVTIISANGSTPREEGAKMLVRDDGTIVGTISGGSLEEKTIHEAVAAMRTGKIKRLSYRLKEGEDTGMICGGNLEMLIEPVLVEPSLFIFGGGHIGLALAKMARLAGFKIVLIDDRSEFATPQRFPEAERTLVTDFGGAFSKLTVRSSDYIVIITHGHRGDEVVLEQALKTEAKYIGMIGSTKKNETIFSHLRAKGVSQELMDKVYTPIGLKINAQTPAEIAVSILAEIVKVRRSPDLDQSKMITSCTPRE